MPSATTGFDNDIINYFLRNQSYTQPPSIYGALSTTVPLVDGTNWTEMTGGGYARQVMTLAAPSAGLAATSAAVTFGPATGADWDAAVAFGIFFVSTGGALKLYKPTSSKIATVGTSITWAAGDLTVTIA